MMMTMTFMSSGARLGLVSLIALLAAFAAVSASPTRALAHGGEYDLTIAPDGVGGISVIGIYVEDGHPVDAVMDPVATAVDEDGRTAGPVSLVSSSEGEGVWVTEEPFLGDGGWTVTVTTTTPLAVTATAAFEVAPLDAPIEPATEQPAEPANAASTWMWVAGAVAVAAAVLAAAILARRGVRRRRARRRSPEEPPLEAQSVDERAELVGK